MVFCAWEPENRKRSDLFVFLTLRRNSIPKGLSMYTLALKKNQLDAL